MTEYDSAVAAAVGGGAAVAGIAGTGLGLAGVNPYAALALAALALVGLALTIVVAAVRVAREVEDADDAADVAAPWPVTLGTAAGALVATVLAAAMARSNLAAGTSTAVLRSDNVMSVAAFLLAAGATAAGAATALGNS